MAFRMTLHMMPYRTLLATIALARLIREKQPRLYHYVFTHRSKQAIAQQLNVFQPTPVLHVSSMYPAEHGCISLVAPLAQHPTNKNEIIVYDLRIDPARFFSLTENELKDRLFTRQDELPDGDIRLPVKTIHINRSPVVVPAKTLTADARHVGNLIRNGHNNILINCRHNPIY